MPAALPPAPSSLSRNQLRDILILDSCQIAV